ncbi:MAG TPA: UvrD-helicase domain-containing protein [Gaiellaceae bacterium]|nr:UvrD-helicase domain-containing protein [Gaiellaceae bacterium]
MPDLVRSLGDVPGGADVTAVEEARTPNAEQLAAIDAPGLVFVSAGAGTGKTTVLVERFVRAVCDRGLPIDSVLAITYTERAAGELRGRIRSRLAELDRHDLARELDGAWISTIHGFCHRLLKAHPFEAAVDPNFRVLDENQSRVLAGEAFDAALEEFCFGAGRASKARPALDTAPPRRRLEDPERIRLLATYGARGLRRMLTRVYETLRSAGRDLVLDVTERPGLESRLEELREAARCALEDTAGLDKAATARESVARALELLERPPGADRLLDLSDLAARGGPRELFADYEEARNAVEQAALDELAARDRALLEELLRRFADAYAVAKASESALDFEDLQLTARDLLRDEPAIRERESWRFRSVLVDEFQDTNRLQCELIDLLATEDLFFVGDEFQSIYRFRHADVEVFRERREAAGGVLALTENYRSRPEVLEVINHLFSSDFGDAFRPLSAAGRFEDPAFGPAVELLVTDKASYKDTGVHWRAAEARHVAERVKELVDSGEATPGEIVLLFAAGTDARLYEQELRALGLPTFRATGRDYYHQQQVVDLLAYLRLLHNRYDDEALVTVLASPFVGLSNDGLLRLRRAAEKRPLYCGLEKSVPEGLSDRDAQLVRAFRQRYDRLAGLAPRASLERLCERIVTEHDYDLAVLAQWDGRRRYANLRKLARLARSYEELRGPDVEGFVRFVRELDTVGASELEAVAEEEGTDVIRLLTIHGAKGLEFKVVVVADAGRHGAAHDADEILCLPDGRLGFRVADPSTGKRRPTSDYQEVKEAEEEASEAERRRLYYVAMTRAIDRLIVSGSIDPERRGDESTPIGWVLGRLDAPELESAGGAPVEIERDGARLVLRVDRFSAAAVQNGALEAGEPQLALFAVEDGQVAIAEAPRLPDLVPVPEPQENRVRRLSYSALALFELCSYRFYVERFVGLRETRPMLGDGDRGPGLAATEIGDAAHVILEGLDLADPRPPEDMAAAVRARYSTATDEEVARIGALVEAYCDSEIARRLASLRGATVERSFAFEHDGVLIHGRLDVFHDAAGKALVVDYKTNVLEDASPEEVVEREYRLQRLVYALACLRAGASEVEVVYQFLERPNDLVTLRYEKDEVTALESELSAAIAAIQSGEFEPTPSEYACSTCPALNLVCAGPNLHGA